jgi:hypothetical protein
LTFEGVDSPQVYDVTDYVDLHPGDDSILNYVGGDSRSVSTSRVTAFASRLGAFWCNPMMDVLCNSDGFKGPQHPSTVWDVIRQYHVGDLADE